MEKIQSAKNSTFHCTAKKYHTTFWIFASRFSKVYVIIIMQKINLVIITKLYFKIYNRVITSVVGFTSFQSRIFGVKHICYIAEFICMAA